MEPAAAWGPYCHQFQLSNWTVEEPAAGLPVEYASIDIPGTCGLQAYVPESSGGQQLVEYNYYHAASNSKHMSQQVGDVDGEAKISNDSHARSVVRQVLGEFKDDIGMTMAKMHRYPACLGAVDKCYTSPRIVAIGPYYHHRLDHLKQAEKVKHAAACHCVKRSGRLLEELYEAVVPIADAARRLYDKDVMAGISYDNFRHMMFFDACFLVQYMLMRGRTEVIDESLSSFMSPNRIDIFHDIMLLENQLPWEVVEIVMSFMPVPMSLISKKFVARMRHCMLPDDRHEPLQQKPFIWYEGYKPPHLLGLLRHYIVGKSDVDYPASMPKNIAFSVSAMELAEIGITLTANKTTELVDMRLINKGGGRPRATCEGYPARRGRAHQQGGAPLLHELPGSALWAILLPYHATDRELQGQEPDEDQVADVNSQPQENHRHGCHRHWCCWWDHSDSPVYQKEPLIVNFLGSYIRCHVC
ncbi:hypothetical protein PAHAL_8G261200 [Panicum hallii]|uniref:Uncharacterized protein n=1 Tax=Panicum hallii TaxID=206008 RepID=A0A2T8IAB9_9POAL|nr:uncharacterized protein LOC112903267 isoform X2 [Panicum hallii]PVH34622.1 hypothetical protein PAHAL_8G261200 [Panicum hallii]